MPYLATILAGILVILVGILIYLFRNYWFIFGPLFVIIFLVFLMIYFKERRDANHNYTWKYVCEVHYYDGNTEIHNFTCEGWESPKIINERGGFYLVCGDTKIPAVTRFKILEKQKIPNP